MSLQEKIFLFLDFLKTFLLGFQIFVESTVSKGFHHLNSGSEMQ